jgi:hypothetical protein
MVLAAHIARLTSETTFEVGCTNPERWVRAQLATIVCVSGPEPGQFHYACKALYLQIERSPSETTPGELIRLSHCALIARSRQLYRYDLHVRPWTC